jgi:hypothetical protein
MEKTKNLPRGVYGLRGKTCRARIIVNAQYIELGTFDTIPEASGAYEMAYRVRQEERQANRIARVKAAAEMERRPEIGMIEKIVAVVKAQLSPDEIREKLNISEEVYAHIKKVWCETEI